MKRPPIIAIVSVLVLLACGMWTVSVSVAQETPEATSPAAPATPDTETAPATPPTTEAAKTNPDVEKAVGLFQNRDVEGALKQLKKACKNDPDLSPPHVILATFFARANLAPQMRAALERAVIDSPDDPEAYFIMAELAMRDRRVTEARLLYDKAQGLTPKVASAKRKELLQPLLLNGLAQTSGAREDWVGAQKFLEDWLKLQPDSAMAMRQLAECLLKQDKEQPALELLVKASKTKEGAKLLSPEASLAQFYAAGGEKTKKKAREWMIAALNASPKDINTRLLATKFAFETGKLAEAKTQADAALKLDPKSIDALFLRALVALFQKDYEGAESFAQTAVVLQPKDFRITNILALALIAQKGDDKKQRAFDYAEANAQKYQKSAEALSTYGWVCYKAGRIEEAARVLQAVRAGGAMSADAAYYLARVYVRTGHDKEAKELLETALKSTAPFENRQDAQDMLDEMNK